MRTVYRSSATMEPASTGLGGWAALKLALAFGVPAALAALIGMLLMPPRSPREFVARTACTVVSSFIFGPLLAIAAIAWMPSLMTSAHWVAQRTGVGSEGLLAMGALVAGSSAWAIRSWWADAEEAKAAAEYARERDAQAQATVAAIEAARTEERRRIAAMEKVRDDAQKQATAAAVDAANARDERDRLRAYANSLAAAAVARNPAAADGSPSGASAIDLLAYMLGRVSDRATELAGIADRAAIAGMTCERIYDALR